MMKLTYYAEASEHLNFQAREDGEAAYRDVAWFRREYAALKANEERQLAWKPDVFRLVRARFDKEQEELRKQLPEASPAEEPAPIAKVLNFGKRVASCL